jgi:hypothetical protein
MQPHRTLMVMRMKDPSATAEIADIFAEHDSTSLPVELGASRRILFRHHDLYMHLIESEEELMPNLYSARQHPVFRRTDERLAGLLSRYDTNWTELKDSRAEIFYDWVADRK